MFPSRIFAILLFMKIWCMLGCRSDPVEASRILEEAFRDYDKRIRPNYGGSPILVNVSIYVLSIPEIDTASMLWNDPRLSFNSRRNIDTITLDAITTEGIWSPDTFFVNELSSVSHDILVKNQFCRISHNGTLMLSRRITLTAYTNMDTGLFPYDSQNLILDMESYGSQTNDLKYQWAEDAVSASSIKTPGFQVDSVFGTDTSLTTSTGSYSRLTLRIKARRKPLPYELGFMLPTFLVAVLCWASVCIKNATLGTITATFLVSLIALMSGLLFISSKMNNTPCLSPLQLYSLLSCAFGLTCLLVNTRNVGRNVNDDNVKGKSDRRKSRTESTSENGNADDLPYGATLDDDDQCVNEAAEKRNKFMRHFRGCRSDKGGNNCVRYSLLVLLLVMNITYFIVFRLFS